MDEVPRSRTYVVPAVLLDLHFMSRERVWALGVERLDWQPEEPPEDWTQEMMIARYLTDSKYKEWEDSLEWSEDE